MIIREVEKKDNKEVENLIRTCLIEYGADKPGCAWSDTILGSFFELYQAEKSKYWVVEKDNKVVAGCGIGHYLVLMEFVSYKRCMLLKKLDVLVLLVRYLIYL